MKAHDVVELAARNLRESVLRNSLTTVGIAVGVASLVAMLSLGIGLQQLANRRLTRSGLFNTVVVMPRDLDRGPSRRNQPTTPARPLDDAAVDDIKKLAHVDGLSTKIALPCERQEALGDRSATHPGFEDHPGKAPHLGKVIGSPFD